MQSSIAHFVWSVVRYNEVLCLVKKIDRAHLVSRSIVEYFIVSHLPIHSLSFIVPLQRFQTRQESG